MLAPSLQRRMTLLALVAMLLLLAVPTVGRLMAASSANSDGVWAQMCTMAGLKLVKIAPGEATPVDPKPKPKSPVGHAMAGEDCAYCPLLAGMAMVLLCVFLGVLRPPAPLLSPWRLFVPRAFLYPSGLGSRGPPAIAL